MKMTKSEKTILAVFSSLIIIIVAVVVSISVSDKNDGKNSNGTTNPQTVSQSESVPQSSDTQPQTQPQSQTQTQPTAQDEITVEQAKQIALKNSGQENNENIVFTKQKKDRENGIWVYEIEFTDRVTEYEYEINTSTGDIVSQKTEPYDFD